MATAADIIARCRALKGNWSARTAKFAEWYSILTLTDVLEQEGMESVTSNDPRTAFNLAKHLIISGIIAHKIEAEELTAEQIPATSYLESYVTKRWIDQDRRYRQMGRQGWIDEMVAFLLGLGWYSTFAMADEDKVWTEVWHPATVFPEFGPDGLVEVAHIYSLSPMAANRKIRQMGWQVRQKVVGNIVVYDHWAFDNDGDAANSIILGTDFVKLPTKDIACSKVDRLPVFISPVGGLPDKGTIQAGKEWQRHWGEPIFGSAEDIIANYNKMMTFQQQMVRDTANPRWFERSQGETPILREADLFKRGAIFRGSVGEDVGPLPVPPIPVELRTSLFEYQNQIQRALFPWAVFGNIQQQMSYLAMANIASASMQVLTPYMNAVKGVLSDIDNFWIEMIRKNGFRPHGYEPPENLPDEVEFQVEANIEIPGYLVQRATVARMLDPTFRLSTTTVMDKMFPEIQDPLREQGKARKDEAMMHPKAIIVDQIIAYKEQARLLRDANDPDSAALYEKLASSMEAELGIPTPESGRRPASPAGVGPEQAVRREVLPQEFTEPPEGMEKL